MKMLRYTLTSLITLILLTQSLAAGVPSPTEEEKKPTMEELKTRFKQRYAVLLKLKETGKVGESYEGYVSPLKKEYLKEQVPIVTNEKGKPINASEERPILKVFLHEENEDRKWLYKLLAEKLGEKPDEIALQNAIRNFKTAKPDHYLLLRNGEWTQKKELDLMLGQ